MSIRSFRSPRLVTGEWDVDLSRLTWVVVDVRYIGEIQVYPAGTRAIAEQDGGGCRREGISELSAEQVAGGDGLR